MPDCQHHWVLDNTEPNPYGPGRVANLRCTQCGTDQPVVTLKTDTELNTELAGQTP